MSWFLKMSANVSAMSSGGLELLTIKIQQMTIESTNDQLPTTPAITYSECCALPYLNYQIDDLDGEQWCDIIGYDGIYLVSNLGRVKSYQREINMGVKGCKIQPARVMKQQVSKSNFNNIKEPSKDLKVTFCVDNIKKTYHVTTLIGNAFIGELKENEVYSKKNKLWCDNRAENLIIMNKSDDVMLSYEKGNNLRKKKHMCFNHEAKYIYKREIDGKTFIGGKGLSDEYKKDVRPNIDKAIKKNSIAYGSFWSRASI